MLCSLKYGIYIFFGAWQFIAIFFTYFLVPETRGVPIEEVRFQIPLPLTTQQLSVQSTGPRWFHDSVHLYLEGVGRKFLIYRVLAVHLR